MKIRIINLAVVMLLVFGLVLASGKSTVLAAGTVPPINNETPVWVEDSETSVIEEIIPMYEVTPVIPDLQLLSPGVVISAPSKICVPFRGAQFGWSGQIRMLFGGAWIPLATTIAWTPTIEGKLMACADAPAAGTFALFGDWYPLE